MRWVVIIVSFVLGAGAGAATVFLMHPKGLADLLERPAIKLQFAEIQSQREDAAKLRQQVETNSSLATRYFNKCAGDQDTISRLTAELSRLRGFCKEPTK